LFDAWSFLPILLIFPLVGFYSYAIHRDCSFFLVIIIGLSLQILYLVKAHYQISKKQAESALTEEDFAEKKNLLDAEISREWQGIESSCKRILNYSQLKGVAEKLCATLTLAETSSVLSDEVNRLFGDQEVTVILYLFHSRTGELGISVSQKGQMRVNIKAKQGDSYDQWVVKVMKPLLIEDARNDFRFDVDKIDCERAQLIRSLMSVPLMIGHKALGILRVDSPQPGHFTSEDIRLLNTIGDLGAVAIENAQFFEHIEDLAIRDSLTGLFLRRHFLERLTQEIGRQLRRKRDLSFLMIDIDEFKTYNDHFGHAAGDLVLKAVGKILLEAFSSPGDLVCRYGGEEFAVLLPDSSKESALRQAEELRCRIHKETISLRRQQIQVTVSIGVATFPTDAQLKEELVGKADLALYKAKNQGRNRVCGE
jgi:diguanylate cyclase (GGDEF)-like protein